MSKSNANKRQQDEADGSEASNDSDNIDDVEEEDEDMDADNSQTECDDDSDDDSLAGDIKDLAEQLDDAGRETLLKMQVRNNDTKAELKKAKIEKKRGGRKKVARKKVKRTKQEGKLMKAAKQFAICNWLFIDDASDLQEDPDKMKPDKANHDWTDWPTIPPKLLVQEYVAVLPKEYKSSEIFMDSDVTTQFTKYMQVMRTEVVTRLRSDGQLGIFGGKLSETMNTDRSSPELKALIGFKETKDRKWNVTESFNVMPPIIYGSDSSLSKEDSLFRSEICAKAARSMLWGKASLTKRNIGTYQTYGSMWHITEITPNIIAFAATSVLFALSADEEFRMIGTTTGIDYLERFVRFRYFAETLDSYEGGQATLEFWHEIVFEGSKMKPKGTPVDNTDDVSKMKKRIAALAAKHRLDEQQKLKDDQPGIEEEGDDSEGEGGTARSGEETGSGGGGGSGGNNNNARDKGSGGRGGDEAEDSDVEAGTRRDENGAGVGGVGGDADGEGGTDGSGGGGVRDADDPSTNSGDNANPRPKKKRKPIPVNQSRTSSTRSAAKGNGRSR